MKKGDIVAVVATSGEYVGELVSSKPVTLANPKMFFFTHQFRPLAIFASYLPVCRLLKRASQVRTSWLASSRAPRRQGSLRDGRPHWKSSSCPNATTL